MKPPWLRAFVFYFAFLWRGILLFFALMIPYHLFYGFILLGLEQHPLIERSIRLTVIVGAMMLALSWGFQWGMRAKFGTRALRVAIAQMPADTSSGSPPELILRQAAQVVWAHL